MIIATANMLEDEVKEPFRTKIWMTKEQASSLLTVAGIPFSKVYKLENKYWPEHTNYDDVRLSSPWWLFKTPYGLIELGWRKRVISIDWSDTSARVIVTEDNVTKEQTLVHAYSLPKAVEYLTVLGRELHKLSGC